MSARRIPPMLITLPLALGLVIAAMIGGTERVVAATENPSKQASSCPHSLDQYARQIWKPTDSDLHLILAKHRGWLDRVWHIDLRNPDAYLDHVDPNWRSMALADPKQANLCNANLEDEPLDGAVLTGADLNGARLTHLSGAHLSHADLRDADLAYADLHGAYLGWDTNLNRVIGDVIGVFQLKGADLTGANLERANLAGADMARATLRDTKLFGVDLSHMRLSGADLRGAHMGCYGVWSPKTVEVDCTNLSGATLSYVKLNGADLRGVSMSKANLESADLSGADLTCARISTGKEGKEQQKCTDLSGANLSRAQVTNAKFAGVDLTKAVYGPVSEPPYQYVAGIKGLEKVEIPADELTGLVQLRKLLQDAGLKDDVRQATDSIQRSVTIGRLSSPSLSFAWIEGVLRIVGFEWTTAYGLHPEWALRWILLLGAVLTPVYMVAMLHPTATSGVVQVFPADRLDGTAGDPTEEQKRRKQLVRAKSRRVALAAAAYFSLISALNIGFEQFTPGDWIRRLQRRAYSLEGVGWVRVVAGIQALLSVYLLAMWVLTQFGELFG